MYRVPIATYRLQFHAGFPFENARAIVPFLADLGITDLYASPILKARKGSPHGYDVVDANALNPELGTEEDFARLHDALRERDLGFLLDVVPNHMAASAENAWWMSVLESGPNSRYLPYFDIDWSPVTVQGKTVSKVLLPILGKPYGEALEAREIQLRFDGDSLALFYYEHRLPLAPESYRIVLRECLEAANEGLVGELAELLKNETISNSKFLKETLRRTHDEDAAFRECLERAITRINETPDDLDRLLDAQWYRLAYWRIASEKINYRRFFDVTDLVGVKVEDLEVFVARNQKTLDLIADGKVTGLRIDHIDGLHDPLGHLKKLQLRLGDPFYVVVEKILEHGETLPRELPVAGTTGYDFLDSVNALFVDPRGLGKLTELYRAFTGITDSFEDIVYERKKQVIQELFAGEMRALGKQLASLSMLDRNARDFAPSELLAALTEITACMGVYRTYIRASEPSEEDRKPIRDAVRCARARASSMEERLFDVLERMLLVEPPEYIAAERENWLAFVMRWQQFTGRVMAKGVEDTAFYNYNRLVSLNEVGGNPGRDPQLDGLAEFHARNERIARDWPDTMNATSTHDTKRSEDVRARINVLSELAESWEREVRRWSRMNASLRVDGVPDPNVELLIYQTLVGFWPLDDGEEVAERLKQYLEKAAREAKTHTSWIAPNADYERALMRFADAILANEEFLVALRRFQRRIAYYGFLNSLSQLVLKLASPGVPDFYQGTELWDFSLVDPDNRRPVDYQRRASLLRELEEADPKSLLRNWTDGRIKLFTTSRALRFRARHAETFRGSYRAVASTSPHAVAFLRGDDVLVVAPRLLTTLTNPGRPPLGAVWGDATLDVGGRWRDAFTGRVVEGDQLRLADLFAELPVALLELE